MDPYLWLWAESAVKCSSFINKTNSVDLSGLCNSIFPVLTTLIFHDISICNHGPRMSSHLPLVQTTRVNPVSCTIDRQNSVQGVSSKSVCCQLLILFDHWKSMENYGKWWNISKFTASVKQLQLSWAKRSNSNVFFGLGRASSSTAGFEM